MTYLEDVVKTVERTRARKAKGLSNTTALLSNFAAQRQAQMAAARAEAEVPLTPARPAPARSGAGSPTTRGAQSAGDSDELWNRLQKMIKDRPSIAPGKRTRSLQEQERLWNLYQSGKGALAAKPGTSPHGSGLANDLKYSNDADREWALKNASKYGLAFPIYNPKLGRGRDEAWHVELAK